MPYLLATVNPETPIPAIDNSNSSALNPVKIHDSQQPSAISEQGSLVEEIPPDLSVADYKKLGKEFQALGVFESARNCYTKVIEIEPESAEIHANLGTLHAQQQQWPEALAYYTRAISLQPSFDEVYRNLARIWQQLGQRERAALCWEKGRNLESKLAAEVNCNSAQIQPEDACEYIWKGLNQLGPFHEESPYCQLEITPQVACDYFSKTSQYKLIHMRALTPEDREFLEKAGLSIEFLESIGRDTIESEEFYINNFGSEPQKTIKLSQKTTRSANPDLWDPLQCDSWYRLDLSINFQQTIVETGYIYTLCPVSGKILRSNSCQLYSIGGNSGICYRFVGEEVFYLITRLWWQGDKAYLYFPKLDIILQFRNECHHLMIQDLINGLKSETVSYWRQLKTGSFNNYKKEVVATLGICFPNLGHYIWNELTGLYYLSENGILNQIDKFLVADYGPYKSFKIRDIFPEIPPEKIILFSNHEHCARIIRENNYLAVRFTNAFIKEQFSQQIRINTLKKCSQEFLNQVEQAQQHFPLLWINLRSSNKVWISQIEGYANIINNLCKEYPNLGLVFDGCPHDQEVMEKILTLIPSTISTYNALHCTGYQSLVWAYAIDLYIAVIGSGLTLVTWLANKPGVAHANVSHTVTQAHWWSQARENAIPPVAIPSQHIVDLEENNHYYCNYDLDWKLINEEVKKIVKNLRKNSH